MALLMEKTATPARYSAEGRADALSLADQSSKPSLADEIAALAGQDKIDEELEAMKRALKGGDEQEG
jgi:phage shock protein A